MKKILKNISLLIWVLYLSVLITLVLIQKKMVYFPDNTPFAICDTFSKDEHKKYNGTNFYETKWSNNNVVIFFHGNAWRACDRNFVKNVLEQTNSSIIFVEYHGYADTDNSPNIKSILQDVKNIWNYIEQSSYENIFVFWRSIWAGPASYYAQNFKVDRLLLVSSYSSLYKIAANQYSVFPVKYIFSENYEPEKYLKNFKNKLLIIHGKMDRVIPLRYGTELFDSVTNWEKELIILPDWNHNNTLVYPKVTSKIIQFFSE
jgi:esterase/lipase